MKLAILGASGSVGREIAVEEEQRAIAYVEESFEISESRSGVSSAEPASCAERGSGRNAMSPYGGTSAAVAAGPSRLSSLLLWYGDTNAPWAGDIPGRQRQCSSH